METLMNTLATGAALVAIMTTALLYGTDLFCALVVSAQKRWDKAPTLPIGVAPRRSMS